MPRRRITDSSSDPSAWGNGSTFAPWIDVCYRMLRVGCSRAASQAAAQIDFPALQLDSASVGLPRGVTSWALRGER